MYSKQITKINKDLEKTGKAIIALGCSFVQGQGAVDDELYTNYKWSYNGLGAPLEIQVDDAERNFILNNYKNVEITYDKLDFTFMEYENSFVNVLCQKYFQGEYTPINFGLRGCGNRATIKELHFHPDIRWDLMKEIIVIYAPSGFERFDFINDTYDDHFRWTCMWPHYEDIDQPERKKLWEGYATQIWSDRFQVFEQIGHVQELVTWCNSKNAKLIITPGFERRYTREYFTESLKSIVRRDKNHVKYKSKFTDKFIDRTKFEKYVELFPWDSIFEPNGFKTFADLTMSNEELDDNTDHFFQFLGTGSPNMWITPCAHPSAKAHDLFAEVLYKYLT